MVTVLDVVRESGTEAAVQASLLVRDGDMESAIDRQALFLARLTAMLEKRRVLKRRPIVNLISTAEGIPDQEDLSEDYD
jgi:hypothetical protein